MRMRASVRLPGLLFNHANKPVMFSGERWGCPTRTSPGRMTKL
jgi:hypothetical protein